MKLVGPFSLMIETPNIERKPDGSLCLSQGASFERGLCLLLGFAALVFCVSLSFEGLRINEVDALAFTTMFGFILGALSFPSTSARLDAQTQTLFWQREWWGCKREQTLRFSEIESIRRIECYETGKMELRVRFRLVVQGRELPLLPSSQLPEQADELEKCLRALLPGCPINPSRQANALDNQLPLVAQRDLRMTSDGGLTVCRSVTFERVACLALAACFLLTLFHAAAGLETFQKVGFAVLVLGCLATAIALQSREWRFDPQAKRLVLLEERAGFKKKRVFDFADVRDIRRESYVVKLDDAPPYTRFRLFLQIGEANEPLLLSPKDLTLAQADELEGAVRHVLNSVLFNELRMESKRERRYL